MRTFIFSALACLPAIGFAQKASTDAKPNFTIEGKLSNFSSSPVKVYINYSSGEERKTDSAEVVNGAYKFQGTIAEPTRASLRVKFSEGASQRRDMALVYLQPGKMKLNSIDSFSNVKVEGSAAHSDFTKLNDQLKSINDEMNTLGSQYGEYRKNNDEAGMKKIQDRAEALEKEMEVIYKKFVEQNPKSPIALYALNSYAGYDINPAEVEPVFNKLAPAIKNSPSGKSFAEKIETAKKTGVGAMAMEFTQNDTLGNPVSLSNFRGKYVLVDFWASWCGPCRVENPNVVAAFEKYKDKGFTVLGISLDQPGKKDKWLEAIHKDKLTWTHVSDLQFWNNAVAKQYGIQAIPQNLLIDPKGMIVGKNLRGEALHKKLEEILGAQ